MLVKTISRFDVAINDSVWYLRATTEDERNHWCEIIEDCKSHNGETTSAKLRRQGSLMSVNSTTVSLNSHGSGLVGRGTTRMLKEKLAELDTFKDILNSKIESLQRFVSFF